VTFDVRLAVICLAIGLAAACAFTALSAVKSFRSNIQTILVASSLSFAPRAGAQRALVVAQLAVGCVMLTIGGLLLRSALNVEHIDVGLGTTEGLMGRVSLDDRGYAPAAGIAFYERIQQALQRYPQVGGVALAWHPPVGRVRTTSTFTIGAAPEQQARYNVVSAAYFKTLGIPLLGGREFDDRDRVGTEPVAIVNETLAASFSGDPLGQSIKLVNESQPRRVVGVAREIKYNGITEPPQPFLYLPMGQVFRGDATVHMRTAAPDAADLLRAELRRIDPDVALSDVRTLRTQLDDARATPRAAAIVAVGAAAIAVFLALVGVYGVLTTSVEQRRRELAIRAALGATERTLARGVAVEGLTLTVAGLASGMLASAGAGRFVTDLLFDVQPLDRLVLGLVPVIGLMVSLIAWIAPVRRAAAIDPVTVLKSS
jgi:predicted permease